VGVCVFLFSLALLFETYCHVYECACMTYKTGSVLDDCVYRHLIHTTRNYRQYGAIAVLHTLQFTVTHALGFPIFTCRILTTDL
jgi:hypothetical protein